MRLTRAVMRRSWEGSEVSYDSQVYAEFIRRLEKEVGREKLREARQKRDAMQHSHLIQTLDALGYLPSTRSYEILKEILKEKRYVHVISGEGKNLFFDPQSGSVYAYVNGEKKEVVPTFFPYEKNGTLQYLLEYHDYERAKKLLDSYKELNAGEKTLEYYPKDVFGEALRMDASDVHIIPKSGYYHVFFRIRNQFVEQPKFLMDYEKGKLFIDVLMIEASRYTKGKFSSDERKVYQDARLVYDDLGIEIRLAYIPDGRSLEHGQVVGRIIRKTLLRVQEDLGVTLKRLGYDEDVVKVWENLLRKRGVLGIVSGKTNSGKSTLIINCLAHVKDRKVVTIEDPVEYETANKNIMHHQVYEPKDESIKMGFVEYTRAFKRGDTDVIFVGELREGSHGLFESVMSAAYAGQLILTTVHVSSAFEIYDFFSSRFAVGSLTREQVLSFVVDKTFVSFNQVLVPKLCSKCKKEEVLQLTKEELFFTSLSEEEKADLLEQNGKTVFRRGEGCDNCNGLGYEGLVPIYEYFIPDRELKVKVMEGKMFPQDIKDYVVKNRDGGKTKGVTKYEIFKKRLLSGEVEKSVVFEI